MPQTDELSKRYEARIEMNVFLGGGFKDFCSLYPKIREEMIQFDVHIFQLGWSKTTTQLVVISKHFPVIFEIWGSIILGIPDKKIQLSSLAEVVGSGNWGMAIATIIAGRFRSPKNGRGQKVGPGTKYEWSCYFTPFSGERMQDIPIFLIFGHERDL